MRDHCGELSLCLIDIDKHETKRIIVNIDQSICQKNRLSPNGLATQCMSQRLSSSINYINPTIKKNNLRANDVLCQNVVKMIKKFSRVSEKGSQSKSRSIAKMSSEPSHFVFLDICNPSLKCKNILHKKRNSKSCICYKMCIFSISQIK